MQKRLMAVVGIVFFSGVCFAQSQDKSAPKGPPPAVVVVSPINTGEVQPMAEFVGTIYYKKVSNVASEVDGRVENVFFDEGQDVMEGQKLVALNTDILDTEIKKTKATYEQALAEVEKARKDYHRISNLYKAESISESVYDEHRLNVRSLEKKLVSLKASLDRAVIEKEKKTIYAPFSGIVLDKSVENGEWVSEGSTVATIGMNQEVDIVVNVPEEVLGYLKKGDQVTVKKAGEEFTGIFETLIPKGDVATRTFTVKIRMSNTQGFFEGMEASVLLPAGEKIEGLLVLRDAVIDKFGRNVVFVVQESKAKMIPVEITGFQGMMVGIAGPGVEAGMQAIVKGNERVREGQLVNVVSQ